MLYSCEKIEPVILMLLIIYMLISNLIYDASQTNNIFSLTNSFSDSQSKYFYSKDRMFLNLSQS